MRSQRKPKKAAPPHAWKKGVSPNPGGRPKLPEDIKESRAMLKESFERIGFQMTQCKMSELQFILETEDPKAWDAIIGRLVYGAALGDDLSRKELLNRLIGKVKEEVDVNATGSFTFTDFVRAANKKPE